MKKAIAIGLAVLLFCLVSHPALALRFGNELISVGDLKHEVYLICGEPQSREVIGYVDRYDSGERIRVMKIEEWIIAETTHGVTYFYSLVFEGNVLAEIKPAGKKK